METKTDVLMQILQRWPVRDALLVVLQRSSQLLIMPLPGARREKKRACQCIIRQFHRF
jgi:hypothetical protein